ncbi:DUF1330 domain-containing protein [Chloroflexota bacterium]
MPAYIIVHVNIHDRSEFNKYVKTFMTEFKEFPGRFLVVSENAEILEGEWGQPLRTVVMEFPTMDAAREWYHSDKYQNIAKIRWGAAKSKMILVDGLS